MGQWTHALAILLASALATTLSSVDAFSFSGGRTTTTTTRIPEHGNSQRFMIGGSFLDSLSSPPNPPPEGDDDNQPKQQQPPQQQQSDYFADNNNAQFANGSKAEVQPTTPQQQPTPPQNTNREKEIAEINNVLDQVEETSNVILNISADSKLSSEKSLVALEESVSEQVQSTTSSTLGAASRRTYRSVGNALKDARTKNQKRLSRSAYEKEKAGEKMARIRKKAEEQLRAAEMELMQKLTETQQRMDEETSSINDLLRAEIELESNRRRRLEGLIESIEQAIQIKRSDLANEESIATEMGLVQSKLKEGAISAQLDDLVSKKKRVAQAERDIVDNMVQWVAEAQSAVEESIIRSNRVGEVLESVILPEALMAGEVEYDYSDIKDVEDILEEAANNAQLSDAKFFTLKENFDDALVRKTILLGWEVPDNLKGLASKTSAKERAYEITEGIQSAIQPSITAGDLEGKEDEEIVGLLAKAVGNAAVGGAKASVFGLKAILDAVTEKDVAAATEKVIENSSKIVKSTNDKDALKESFKSTGETIGAIGEASGMIAKNVGKTKSASNAQKALKQTSQDIASALNAVAALGMKNVKKIQEEAEKSIAEVEAAKKDKNRE